MTRKRFGQTAILGFIVVGIGFWAAGCKEKVEHRHHEPQPVPGWTEIDGRVFVDRKPCSDARITVFWGKGRAYKQMCSTDRKGYFVIGNIPAHREIAVEFCATRHKREYFAARTTNTGRPGEILRFGDIDLHERHPAPCPKPMPGPCPKPGPAPHPERCDLNISGSVCFDGRPIKEATVRVVSVGGYECKAKTDKRGCFRVKDVPRKARVEIFINHKIHHARLVGSAVIHTGRDNMDIGTINLCKEKK